MKPANPIKTMQEIRRMAEDKQGVDRLPGESEYEALMRAGQEADQKKGNTTPPANTDSEFIEGRTGTSKLETPATGKRKTAKQKSKAKPDTGAATTVSELLEAAARRQWHIRYDGEDCPDEQIPTEGTLVAWYNYRDGPIEAAAEVERLVNAVWGGEWFITSTIQARPGGLRVTFGVSGGAETLDTFRTWAQVHEAWRKMEPDERPEHPLIPLVEAWQDRAIPIDSDTRDRKIIPRELAGGLIKAGAPALILRALNDNAIDQIDQLGINADGTASHAGKQLSLIQDNAPDEVIPDNPGLILADHAGLNTPQRGRGERIDKRLMYYCTTSVPQEARRPGSRVTLTPTLREIARGWIWPRNDKGRSSWQPHRDALPLYRAMEAVTLAGVMLPDGRIWAPVIFRAYPNFRNLDSKAEIEIHYPTETPTGGAMIDWRGLVEAGAISGPAFDGAVTLATLWDKAKASNNGNRIYATRPAVLRDDQGFITRADSQRIIQHGQPVKNWRHPQAVHIGIERHPQADKVPLLDRDDRRRLFYGKKSDSENRRRRSEQATKADQRLIDLENQGRVVIEREGNKWRILEPYPTTET